jgi:hypothetical protein
MVLSRLDYGNATLCGLPDYECRRMQSVLNAAAKSIFRLQRSDHVTAALNELCWLSAADRINFKGATWSTPLSVRYRASSDVCLPHFIGSPKLKSVVGSDRQLTLISYSYRGPGRSLLAIVRFEPLGRGDGTAYQQRCGRGVLARFHKTDLLI